MDEKKAIFPRVPLYYSIPMLAICLVAFFILVFLFRIETSGLLLQPVPINVINVSSCGELNQSNTYYVLNQSIVYQLGSSKCIEIRADNITLDGQFRSFLDESTSFYNTLIPITIYGNNVTVTRMNISDVGRGVIYSGISNFGLGSEIYNNYIYGVNEYGIISYDDLERPQKSVINNNYIYNSTYAAIYISGDSDVGVGNSVWGNVIRDSGSGIYVHDSEYNQIYDNLIERINKPIYQGVENFSLSFSGVYIDYSDYNFIFNNTIKGVYNSIILYASDSVILGNIDIQKPEQSGIYAVESGSIIFSNVVISDARRNGLWLYVPSSNGDVLKASNFKVINGNISYNDLYIVEPFPATLNRSVYLANSSFSSYKLDNILLTVSNSFGRIEFNKPLNISGADFNSDIRITSNNAEVNSSLRRGLNKSATISFFGIQTNITNVSVLRNGVLCPSSICSNVTYVGTGAAIFDVTGWTKYTLNYTIGIGGGNGGGGNGSMVKLVIVEPPQNKFYTISDFPVKFNVSLIENGTVKFSLNNGSTNVTMNTTNNRVFTYVQNALAIGNYTFTAYGNFSNGTLVSQFHDFRVVDFIPTMTINEPDENERYTTASFPVTFNVGLNMNGTVKFSLNNGATNVTMGTTDNRTFTYEQSSLSVRNYTFTAYAVFLNGARINDSVKFSVVNSSGSTGRGSNSGGSSGGSSGSGSGGATSGNTTGGTSGGTTTGGSGTGDSDGGSGDSKVVLGNTIYWFIILIIVVIAVILTVLVVRSLRERAFKKSLSSFNIGKRSSVSERMVSNLK